MVSSAAFSFPAALTVVINAGLLRLHLFNVDLFPSEALPLNLADCPQIPSLRTLSLVDPLHSDVLAVLHAAPFFPSLENLILACVEDYGAREPSVVDPEASDLAPQLRTLSLELGSIFAANGAAPLESFIRRCTHLEHFRLAGPDDNLLSAALATPIQHLWLSNFDVGSESFSGEDVVEALRASDAGRNLIAINLPPAFKERAGMMELEVVCQRRGIALIEDSEGCDLRWEDFVELGTSLSLSRGLRRS